MLALLLVLALQDEVVKESEHPLDPGAVITARTVVGRVRLTGTDEKKARVKTVKRGRDRDLVEITVDADKGSLTVEARFPKRRSDIDIEIEIDIQVPRTAKRLEGDVVSGSIEVKDAKGDATLKSVSGSIRVDGLTGNLTAVSISGRIGIARLAADSATINLTSGSLEGAGEAGALDLTTVSGNAVFDLTPRGDAWSVKSSSVSGDLRLTVAASAGGKVDFKSLSGRLHSELDLREMKTGDRRDVERMLRGVFGEGKGTIRASTISGDITLAKTRR